MSDLQKIIDESSNIVFFGGAGVSTESGIPDFRSADGLYNQKYDVPPETMLSHSYFVKHPEEFIRFHKDKMLCRSDLVTCTTELRESSFGRREMAGRKII